MSWARFVASTLLVLSIQGCGNSGGSSTSADLQLESLLSLDKRDLSAAMLEMEAIFQDELASCLDEQGFEYFSTLAQELKEADEFSKTAAGAGGSSLSAQLPSLEGARDQGFGMYEGWVRRATDSVSNTSEGPSKSSDRNVPYLESLSESELLVYGEARYGDDGCESVANESSGFRHFDELSESAARISENVGLRLDSDNTISAMTDDWTSCMKSNGYPDPSDPLTVQRLADSYYVSALEGIELTDSTGEAEIRRAFETARGKEILLALSTAECLDGMAFAETLEQRYTSYLEVELRAAGQS